MIKAGQDSDPNKNILSDFLYKANYESKKKISKDCTHFNRHINNRSSIERTKQRVVTKTGNFNVEKWRKASSYVFPDFVTAFIDSRWRWTLLYCILTNLTVWFSFTAVWWIIIFLHGDLQKENLPHAVNNTDWKPCVTEIYGFTSIFLFTIEIQTTVGYGNRALTLECPSGIITMCLESIIGTIIQSFIVGVVFAKLTRPKNRVQTLLFSKNAIINQRDRNLCLMFRVGNTRKSRIISVSVYAFLIRYVTSQGDILKNEQIELDLKVDDSDDILFLFPISVVHKIDANSPFFSMTAKDIISSEMEILVVLEGTIESTGQPLQAKSSYTAHEILWGHRFVQLVDFPKDKQGFVVDYSKFNETRRVNTPLCAANSLKNFYKNMYKRKR